jgi:NitT/TauT family transport system substrate-binding protein
MKRSAMIAISAAAMGAAALPAYAQSETIRFGVVGVEEAALPYYAQEKGLFKAAGLNVVLSVMPNGGSVTQGILGGALDVGVTNSGSMSSAFIRGLPLQMLACGAVYAPRSPISHLAVGKASGIASAKDLAGKTFAVSTLHDMIQGTVLAWLEKNGGDWKAINFVEMPPAQMAAAIAAKRIDGGAIVEPFFTASKDDLTNLGYNYSAVNDNKAFQTLGIVTSKDWYAKNAATGKKVAAAIHDAAKWANNSRNFTEAATLMTTFTKVEPAVIAGYPRLAFAESNNPGLIQPVIDMLTKYAYIPHGFSAAELFAPGVG